VAEKRVRLPHTPLNSTTVYRFSAQAKPEIEATAISAASSNENEARKGGSMSPAHQQQTDRQPTGQQPHEPKDQAKQDQQSAKQDQQKKDQQKNQTAYHQPQNSAHAAQPSGPKGDNPATAGPGPTKVQSNTPENSLGRINPSAPEDSNTTPGTSSEK
jgi:hypothetical protein